MSKEARIMRLDKRDDSNEEMHKRIILVELAGEQRAKDNRQEIDAVNNSDERVNPGMASECDQIKCEIQKNIQIMGSQYGKFELARDTGDIQSSTNSQGVHYPI
ncbi:MAG: hypothetical protein EZS28_053588 [Streblomastix strix]|uniref:Uncharacterized protein n=1 Tax=Streblomastix strix TaxID=222440 RepID=A0A5J4R8G2_9EUKA|nr:MAG: hypothetical protein EZS28_053588 [Streblomastix strix]